MISASIILHKFFQKVVPKVVDWMNSFFKIARIYSLKKLIVLKNILKTGTAHWYTERLVKQYVEIQHISAYAEMFVAWLIYRIFCCKTNNICEKYVWLLRLHNVWLLRLHNVWLLRLHNKHTPLRKTGLFWSKVLCQCPI